MRSRELWQGVPVSGVASGTQVHTLGGAGRGARDLGRTVGGGVGEADTGDPDRRWREAAACAVSCICESPLASVCV